MLKLIGFFAMMVVSPVLLPFWLIWVCLSALEKGRTKRREKEIEVGVRRALGN